MILAQTEGAKEVPEHVVSKLPPGFILPMNFRGAVFQATSGGAHEDISSVTSDDIAKTLAMTGEQTETQFKMETSSNSANNASLL
eukprot:4194491-Amphidinium_carterae.1